MAMQKLGQQKRSVELAVPNVELAWKIDDVFMQRANAYTQLMHENKQIRQLHRPRPVRHQAIPVARITIEDCLERARHGASGSHATEPRRKRRRRRAAAPRGSTKLHADRARRRLSRSCWFVLLALRRRLHRHAADPEPAPSRGDDVRLLVRRHLRRRLQRHDPHPHLEVDARGSTAASSSPR